MSIKIRILMFGFALAALESHVAAQLTKLENPERFSQSAVLLDFSDFQAGLEASEIYSKWGISFAGPSLPSIGVFQPEVPIPGQPDNPYLKNGIGPGPLVIDLARPAVRLGFALHVPNLSAATISAYDRFGGHLGTATENVSGRFVGLETASALGISKVTVDYGSSSEAEIVDDLLLDFLVRPTFRTYLPQLADAAGLDTRVVILNVSNSTAQGEVRFLESGGEPLTVQIEGQQQSVVVFSIPSSSSKSIVLRGSSSEVRTGYAIVDSAVPLSVQAVYQTRTDTRVLEAGIVAGVASASATGAVEKDRDSGLESAIAVVNTSEGQAFTLVVLRNEAGEAVASNNSDFDLPPGGHTARFLSELFPALGDFEGTVEIISTQPLAGLILRTVEGSAASSSPLGDTRQR